MTDPTPGPVYQTLVEMIQARMAASTVDPGYQLPSLAEMRQWAEQGYALPSRYVLAIFGELDAKGGAA